MKPDSTPIRIKSRGRQKADDIDLLTRISDQNDVKAFSTFYDRHAATVFGMAGWILKNDTEAEDVLQDIFLHIWNGHYRYQAERGGVAQWLRLLARSRAIDRLRTRKRRAEQSGDWSSHDDEGQTMSEPMGNDLEPMEELTSRERQVSVQKALTGLPEIQRKVIELAYYERLTQAEIAERIAVPLGTVKTRMRLALIKLAAVLETQENAAS